MYKYFFGLVTAQGDVVYDITPNNTGKAFAAVQRNLAYRAFFEDQQLCDLAKENLVQYTLRNVAADAATSCAALFTSTMLESFGMPLQSQSAEEIDSQEQEEKKDKKRKHSDGSSKSKKKPKTHWGRSNFARFIFFST